MSCDDKRFRFASESAAKRSTINLRFWILRNSKSESADIFVGYTPARRLPDGSYSCMGLDPEKITTGKFASD